MLLRSLKVLLKANTTSKKTVLFHRDYLRFQGGHLKVWHYFQHLQATEKYSPQIYFTPKSIQDKNLLWQDIQPLAAWQPAQADILFLAGLDWLSVINNTGYLEKRKSLPVINLIQGLSHADPLDVKYNFLKNKAIRICVSAEVSTAIQETGMVNGPIFTIPNGVDLNSLPVSLTYSKKDLDILIVAIKKPELGLSVEAQLRNNYHSIKTISALIPRAEFLELMNRAKLVVCLPHFAEGFYLPALEAMALGCLVICPDCIGNRSFCLDQKTCFFPKYDTSAIMQAINQAQALNEQQRNNILENASQQVQLHSLEREAKQFLAIMSNLSSIW